MLTTLTTKFELAFAPHFGRETTKRCFQLVCLDSTHNTVRQKYNLFTLLVQNEYGHGVPVAYLISSDATSPTIQKFLSAFKQFCPLVLTFMTDNDRAEIDAIKKIFPTSQRLLCWWHVEKAWFTNHPTPKNPDMTVKELVDELSKFLRHCHDFDAGLERIKDICSNGFFSYLEKNWLRTKETWAAAFRQDAVMYKRCDTNMLLESFHKTLKITFFDGNVNRRVDKLIYTLVGPCVQYLHQKATADMYEMNGPCPIKAALRKELEEKNIITSDMIRPYDMGAFLVQSFKDPNFWYICNPSVELCTCKTFLMYQFCKHVFRLCVSLDFENAIVSKHMPSLSSATGKSDKRPTPPNHKDPKMIRKDKAILFDQKHWEEIEKKVTKGDDVDVNYLRTQFIELYEITLALNDIHLRSKPDRKLPSNIKGKNLNFSINFCNGKQRGRPKNSEKNKK